MLAPNVAFAWQHNPTAVDDHGLVRIFDNEAAPRHLNKQTLALQCSPQASFWSRPVIRVFVTKGSWTNASNSWGFVDQGGVFSERGQTNGITYGAQIEAWW